MYQGVVFARCVCLGVLDVWCARFGSLADCSAAVNCSSGRIICEHTHVCTCLHTYVYFVHVLNSICLFYPFSASVAGAGAGVGCAGDALFLPLSLFLCLRKTRKPTVGTSTTYMHVKPLLRQHTCKTPFKTSRERRSASRFFLHSPPPPAS